MVVAGETAKITEKQEQLPAPKRLLKWPGGKTQLLSELLPKVPKRYARYIEPFFGGGALFFALSPEQAIIAGNNPELLIRIGTLAERAPSALEQLS